VDPSLSLKQSRLASAENNGPDPAFFFEAGTRSPSIIQIEVAANTGTLVRDCVVGVKINLFVLHRSP